MIRYLADDYDWGAGSPAARARNDPTHYVSHLRMGLVCLEKSLPNEAIERCDAPGSDDSGGSTEALAGLAQAHAVTGDKLAMDRI